MRGARLLTGLTGLAGLTAITALTRWLRARRTGQGAEVPLAAAFELPPVASSGRTTRGTVIGLNRPDPHLSGRVFISEGHHRVGRKLGHRP